MVVLMSPSFSASLKAHRFLHTLNLVARGASRAVPPCFRVPAPKLSTGGETFAAVTREGALRAA